jgi:high-affinity nickel-transport protein
LRSSLDRTQRRSLAMMAIIVGGLHAAGFGILLVLVAPARHKLGSGAALPVGIGITAYTLGMRHAFDADHIAAIDNATRKLIAERKRPLTAGFWFSLGHSSVVFALTFGLALGLKSLAGPVRNSGSQLHRVTGLVGTLVSGGFLYLIAAINIVILFGIVRVLGELRAGRYDERALEQQLDKRGVMNRVLGRLTRAVSKPTHMYPIGFLFGLGFDTASEVALLVLAGGAATAGLPWYAIICLPILFAAGMSLLDALDGVLMTGAYGWALNEPIRRVFYNLTITGLSVAVALVIGTIELGGLLAARLRLSGSFWSALEHVDINMLGFVIVGLFLATSAIAVIVWRIGRIEERWSAHLDPRPTPTL